MADTKSTTASTSSTTDDIFNKLAISDLIRLGYTYAVFIFVAIILIKFQTLAYPHVLVMTVLYIIFTLIAEILWLYAFVKRNRSDAGKNSAARDTFHTVLNNILPFLVLIFGYVTLIDGFRNDHFASDGQHIEFYIRGISSVVFLIGYMYLFYELISQLDTAKATLNTPVNDTWTTDHPDNKATKYDNIIDLLYNLFQPITIMIIAALMYFTIRASSTTATAATTV